MGKEFYKKKEISELFVSQAIRFFALSLVGIFIPIYLWQLNYSFIGIMWFYAVIFIFSLPAFVIGLFLVSYMGFKHTMLFSVPFTLFYVYQLLHLEETVLNPVWLALPGAVGAAFYWAGVHADVAKNSSRKERGYEIALLQSARMGVKIVAPLLGGLTIAFFGYAHLFKIVLFLLAGSMIPLLFSRDKHFGFSITRNLLFKKQNAHDSIYYFAEGIHEMAIVVLLPFFIFLVGVSVVPLGLLFSISTCFEAFLTMRVGRFLDEGKEYLRSGSVFNGILTFFMIFIRGFFSAGLMMILKMLAQPFLVTPFEKRFYDHARKLEGVFVREFWLGASRISFFLLLAFLFFYLQSPVLVLQIGILFGAAAAFVMGGFR